MSTATSGENRPTPAGPGREFPTAARHGLVTFTNLVQRIDLKQVTLATGTEKIGEVRVARPTFGANERDGDVLGNERRERAWLAVLLASSLTASSWRTTSVVRRWMRRGVLAAP
jgi:hypothetical protein